MKKPLPLAVPLGYQVYMTQPFGDTAKVEWYKANGLNISAHNGLDLVVWKSGITEAESKRLTYGTKIVCPVPNAVLDKTWWENPMSTKGNGIQIAWTEGTDTYKMLAWHCSEINPKPKYVLEEQIGLIGNSGLVDPKPSPACVFCGSHLHLMLYKNSVLIDPEIYFDIKKWYTAPDTGKEKDLAPFAHFLSWISAELKKLIK